MDSAHHGGPFDRTGESFGFRRSPGGVRCGVRKIDPVLKVNLAPLMGRRDAAFDQAAESIGSDVFSLSAEKRLAVYGRITRLLALALEDCDQIISGLSSQDTISREKLLRSFISTLHASAVTLGDFSALGGMLGTDARKALAEFDANGENPRLAESEKMLGSTEENLVDLMRRLFTATHPRLARYRAYARQSFSPVYAEKYAVSYKSYSDVYGKDGL
ncbi:MAG: hypothetical protein IJS01_04730 [Lentisphaeria bacterium]|nr:hypothetical protein [Lentisphaeria bacterium]